MKLKNIYKMCMGLSLLFGVFPLFALVLANIFGQVGGCGWVLDLDSLSTCYDPGLIYTLFSLSIYWVITLPLGFVLWLVFYWMYATVRRK